MSERVSAEPDVAVEESRDDGNDEVTEREESDDGKRTVEVYDADEYPKTDADYLRVTEEELSGLAKDASNAAAGTVASTVEDAVRAGMEDADLELAATVTLSDEQYQEVRSILVSDLQTSVVMVGITSLILGAIVGVALTLHWRGGRG